MWLLCFSCPGLLKGSLGIHPEVQLQCVDPETLLQVVAALLGGQIGFSYWGHLERDISVMPV